MAKMDKRSLKAILDAEKQDAMAAMSSSKLSQEREDAMRYYLGDVSKDLPSVDGRSKAVSMDVSDTIEGLMPSLMEIFTAGDEVVQFEAVGPEDVDAAEQETDYVNHVFMQKNPGFLILYTFIKDALLSKVGVVKVRWDKWESQETETYFDQPDDVYAMLVAAPDVEIVEHTEKTDEYGQIVHDVKLSKSKEYACAKVDPVPPEEFGISRRARSIRDSGYCFHEVVKTESELIDDGYDPAQIKSLASYTNAREQEETARDTVNESSERQGDSSLNDANRPIRVTEHYIRMNYDGKGAKLYRVTTGGEDGKIISRTDEDEVVEEDFMPFAAMTPVIITHRFFGRSIADLVMDIMQLKTAMLRALVDNTNLANNPRTEISESHATDTTLDDLLVSRPGGIVRTRQPGGLNVLAHPDIGGHIYPFLEYQDSIREWRTGVTRQGQGLDANALQNQTATATNQLFSAAQARMKLIARIFAETGIRDMFLLLHAVIRKNGSQVETVQLRNQWVQVNPREWKTRQDMTINVGLGTGGKSERMAHLSMMMDRQAQALEAGLTQLVSPKNLYNSAKELIKLIDLKTVEPYFTDPESPEGQQATQEQAQRPDPKVLEAQGKLELEREKAGAGLQLDQAKMTAAQQMDAARLEQEGQIKIRQMEAEFALRREQMMAEFELRREEMALEAQIKREANAMNATVAAEKSRGDGITDTQMGGEVG